MKNKWHLAASIFQLVIGIVAIAAFVVLAVNRENMLKWIPALILAIFYSVMGIVGIKNYISGE